jgi:two-component system chemotaxis response regulator CheY
MKILIVDDSKAIHAFMKAILAGTQAVLSHAFNGREAVDLVAAGNKFDVILLDWEMLVLDGPGALVGIRAKDAAVPIVMVTSKNEIMDIQRALEAGANEYVIKPFTKEILHEKISSVTGREVA